MTTPSRPAHVLLIGIDAYPAAPLHGCVNDIRAIERLLVDRLGVDRARVTCLASPHPQPGAGSAPPSRSATLASIREALVHLSSECVALGDPVFIYYSGHGTQNTVTSGAERYFREALVPVDVRLPQGSTQLLFDFELNGLLRRIGQRTQNVTVVLDCCSSAGVTRDGLFIGNGSDRFLRVALDTAVESAIALQRAEVRGVVHALTSGIAGCQVVAACLADERARELDDPRGERHGALTTALLAQLEPLEPAELQAVRWGAIWRKVLAHVASISPVQHPWLYGDFGRRVFDGGGGHAAMGFGIVRRGSVYHIDAGSLFGVTEGARVVVEAAAPAPDDDGAAPSVIGRVQVASATRFAAEATAVDGAFDVPADAHARLEVPGRGGQLAVALDAVTSDVAALVHGEPFARVVPSAEAEVWLTTRPDGSHVVRDDAHGSGAGGEPVLIAVPAAKRAYIPDVLVHCACYRAPLRLARACTDLPGQLEIALLRCDDDVWSDLLDLQNPALPEVASATGAYPYQLRDGEPFCVRIKNRSSSRLYVTLLNAAASGGVEYLGDAPIRGGGLHTFWRGAALGEPFEATVMTDHPIGLDRFIAIGTTEPGRSLRFLEQTSGFSDAMEARGTGERRRDLVAWRSPLTLWTSQVTALLIHASGTTREGPSRDER